MADFLSPEEIAAHATAKWNGGQSAHPIQASEVIGSLSAEYGLTKREYFAAQVIQGMCSDCDDAPHFEDWDAELIAKTAVRITDALLLELAK